MILSCSSLGCLSAWNNHPSILMPGLNIAKLRSALINLMSSILPSFQSCASWGSAEIFEDISFLGSMPSSRHIVVNRCNFASIILILLFTCFRLLLSSCKSGLKPLPIVSHAESPVFCQAHDLKAASCKFVGKSRQSCLSARLVYPSWQVSPGIPTFSHTTKYISLLPLHHSYALCKFLLLHLF